MSKIVFLDIDGTIRDFDGSIPDSAARAIARARACGHEVLISSGRPECEIEPRVMALGFDGVISASGSYVSYHGRCIRHEYFPPELYRELTGTLLENDCLVQFQCHEKTCIMADQEEDFVRLGRDLQAMLGEDAMELSGIPQAVDGPGALEQVEKLLYFSDSFSNEDVVKTWGSRLYVVPLSFPNPRRFGGELSLATANKAEGIKCVLAAAGKDSGDTVAVGDSDNDLEMLRFCGLGIAMGNATPAARAAADRVTDDLKNDGLYKAFEMAGLFEKE